MWICIWFSILFCWSTCLFLCKQYAVFISISIALFCVLSTSTVVSPALVFFSPFSIMSAISLLYIAFIILRHVLLFLLSTRFLYEWVLDLFKTFFCTYWNLNYWPAYCDWCHNATGPEQKLPDCWLESLKPKVSPSSQNLCLLISQRTVFPTKGIVSLFKENIQCDMGKKWGILFYERIFSFWLPTDPKQHTQPQAAVVNIILLVVCNINCG